MLEQNNSQSEDPHYLIWNDPEARTRGLGAFRAIEAARRQGADAFDRMHFALLEGRHERRVDFREPPELEVVAQHAGLDINRYRKDIEDPSILAQVEADHFYGVQTHGIFGTPTFVFPNGEAFFMRIKAPATAVEAATTWDNLLAAFVDRGNISEVKRPQKPD